MIFAIRTTLDPDLPYQVVQGNKDSWEPKGLPLTTWQDAVFELGRQIARAITKLDEPLQVKVVIRGGKK